MKRLNETTGQPFKYGDVREDGFIFKEYRFERPLKKNGYFQEKWNSVKHIAVRTQTRKNYVKNNKAYHLFLGANSRANRNNAKCTITEEWIQERIDKGVCELTGLPFDLEFAHDTKNNPYAPSLDRIDSKNKNYTPDNVRVVLSFVNIAINDLGLEKALPIFKALIEKNDEKK